MNELGKNPEDKSAGTRKVPFGEFFLWLTGDVKRLILISIGVAFLMMLFAFCLSRVEQSYAFPSCAILWGAGLIAWAICCNKKE